MIFEDEDKVKDALTKHQTVTKWVTAARDQSKVLKALVTGEKFNEVLITRIEKIENKDRQVARKKYSKDIRDLFSRVMTPRINVFTASGGSVSNSINKGAKRDRFVESITHYKGHKSIKGYLQDNYFHLSDTDPNGLIFTEYKGDEDIYPTYKDINDIRYYESNGQLCNYLIFEPVTTQINGQPYQIWRIVDDKMDYRFKQLNGGQFELMEDLTFEHPFGVVPAVILSPYQKTGSELRYSNINQVTELAKDYARDKSILTIYKFQNGFPKHGKYEAYCRTCQGTGKTGENSCKTCDGKGISRIGDVTDSTILDMPRSTDTPLIAPNTEWFVSPDLATWGQYKTDLRDMEDMIDATMWGTRRVTEATNETATGRFIDVQPVMTKLGEFSNTVEWVHNKLADYVESWVNGVEVSPSEYHFGYGHRFIIESADVLLNNYTESKDKGDNSTILDKLLDEYLLAKYQSNLHQLITAQKKRQVEPYVHDSITTVNSIFGSVEAQKKPLFVDFWEQADTNKDVTALKTDWESYFNTNAFVKVEEVPPA